MRISAFDQIAAGMDQLQQQPAEDDARDGPGHQPADHASSLQVQRQRIVRYPSEKTGENIATPRSGRPR